MLPFTAECLAKKIDALVLSGVLSTKTRITFVNDGSTDGTWQVINELYKTNKYVCGINLSRNRGHQNALLCGLLSVYEESDAVISMDADGQDDIDAIDAMIEKYLAGADVVYGVRNDRHTDTFFKRFSAQSFYKMMSALGVSCVYNHADYRLMSRRAVEALSQYKEVNLFLRALVPELGFKTAVVYYARKERTRGKSKYPLKKMIAFAFDGITSMSMRPMTMIMCTGFLCVLFSAAMMCYFFVRYFTGNTVPGWASLAVSIWFLGGVQVASIGIIGYYIGKTYLETKARPRYIIESYIKQ